jgi:hypothetical protein
MHVLQEVNAHMELVFFLMVVPIYNNIVEREICRIMRDVLSENLSVKVLVTQQCLRLPH